MGGQLEVELDGAERPDPAGADDRRVDALEIELGHPLGGVPVRSLPRLGPSELDVGSRRGRLAGTQQAAEADRVRRDGGIAAVVVGLQRGTLISVDVGGEHVGGLPDVRVGVEDPKAVLHRRDLPGGHDARQHT